MEGFEFGVGASDGLSGLFLTPKCETETVDVAVLF